MGNKGKSIFVIGHIDKDTFVSNGVSVHVHKLEELAKKHQVSLLLLGCHTESAVTSINTNYVGTLSTIRASRAIEQLISAAEKSETWADFLGNLSAQDIPLKISKNFMRDHIAGTNNEIITSRITIAKNSQIARVLLEVGTIWLIINIQEIDSCQDTNSQKCNS